jgi:phospholipase C
MRTRAVSHCIFALSVCLALSACAGSSSSLPGPGATSISGPSHHRSGTPIQHIVLLIQENRTFNNLFAQFPGATGTTTGLERIKKGGKWKQKRIALAQVPLESKKNPNHIYVSYLTAYDNGKMDAFNRIIFQLTGKREGTLPYQYVKQSDVQPYWDMATQYGLANAMFSTQGSGSFTGHQDLIRGGTEIGGDVSIIDDPTSSGAWGCDSPPGAKTSLITTSLKYEKAAGPFPCTSHFPYSSYNYTTLADLFDASGITWKYYVPQYSRGTSSALWNAFDVIASVRNGNEWGTNVNWPETNIFSDLTSGKLPQMSWVIPDSPNSDHPGYSSDKGPSWVASVVNAVGQSSYWNSTAIIVVWDDWGGFYDPVAPATQDNQGGPGFRVPMIVISPYVPPSEISQTTYGFGSIVKYIEDTFELNCIGTTDCSSTSIADMFNYNQSKRKFKAFTSKYSRSHFLHHKPSGMPVDTE